MDAVSVKLMVCSARDSAKANPPPAICKVAESVQSTPPVKERTPPESVRAFSAPPIFNVAVLADEPIRDSVFPALKS